MKLNYGEKLNLRNPAKIRGVLFFLNKIKTLNKDVHKEATGKLKTLINDTLDLSLGDLKAKYLG